MNIAIKKKYVVQNPVDLKKEVISFEKMDFYFPQQNTLVLSLKFNP